MARRLPVRQMVVSVLALWHGVAQKEIGARTGMNQRGVSIAMNHGAMKDELFERLIAAIGGTRAEVSIVTGLAEALHALDEAGDLTQAEQDEIERKVLEFTRFTREVLTQAALRARPGASPAAPPSPQPVQTGVAPRR